MSSWTNWNKRNRNEEGFWFASADPPSPFRIGFYEFWTNINPNVTSAEAINYWTLRKSRFSLHSLLLDFDQNFSICCLEQKLVMAILWTLAACLVLIYQYSKSSKRLWVVSEFDIILLRGTERLSGRHVKEVQEEKKKSFKDGIETERTWIWKRERKIQRKRERERDREKSKIGYIEGKNERNRGIDWLKWHYMRKKVRQSKRKESKIGWERVWESERKRHCHSQRGSNFRMR